MMFGGKWGKANHSSEGTLPHDAEAAVLVGRSLQGIAHEWNTYGVKTVRDNTWSDGASRGAVQRSQRGHPPVSRPRGHRGCLARHRGPRRLRGRAGDPDRPSAGAPSASRVRPSVFVDWAGALRSLRQALGSTTNHERPAATARRCRGVCRPSMTGLSGRWWSGCPSRTPRATDRRRTGGSGRPHPRATCPPR